MTWVLIVWFWTGSVDTAPSMVAVPGFTSEANCLQAAVHVGTELKEHNKVYSPQLVLRCEQQ